MGSIRTHEQQGVTIITLSGEFKTEADGELPKTAILAGLNAGKRAFVLDHRDAVGSTFLKGVISVHRSVVETGARLVLVIAPMITIGGPRGFEYYFSLEDAVAALTEK